MMAKIGIGEAEQPFGLAQGRLGASFGAELGQVLVPDRSERVGRFDTAAELPSLLLGRGIATARQIAPWHVPGPPAPA
jgi:hypothetical protein